MPHQIQFLSDSLSSMQLGKVVCVGRNYAEHAKELNNPVPTEPILFIKPATAAAHFESEITVPRGGCHYETELAFLIGKQLKEGNEASAKDSIVGVGLALDLTKRELQSDLKAKSLPWELAKSFDGACPISKMVPIEKIEDISQLTFSLAINDNLVQSGDSRDMLNPTLALISYISHHFTLEPGDLVLTGTPKGVGPLPENATLNAQLDEHYAFSTSTVRQD